MATCNHRNHQSVFAERGAPIWSPRLAERFTSTGRRQMASVFLPPSWRDLAGNVLEITVEGGTVRQLLNSLEEKFPGIRDRIVEDDAIRPGLAICINGTVSRLGLRQPVPAGAEVHFLPALGGG